jgi:hypothetical protein
MAKPIEEAIRGGGADDSRSAVKIRNTNQSEKMIRDGGFLQSKTPLSKHREADDFTRDGAIRPFSKQKRKGE